MSVLWLSMMVVGCGPKLQPAGGKVLVDGVPVKSGGTIMFCPTQPGRPAVGTIGEDGGFTLSFEEEGDGLPIGEYKVVIVADIWKESKASERQRAAEEAAMKKTGATEQASFASSGELIHVVPPIYNDLKTTPLTQKVENSSQPQQFVYDLPAKKK